MKSFIYRGYVISYEKKDDKIVLSEVFYGSKTRSSDKVFSSLDALKSFIDDGGWETGENK